MTTQQTNVHESSNVTTVPNMSEPVNMPIDPVESKSEDTNIVPLEVPSDHLRDVTPEQNVQQNVTHENSSNSTNSSTPSIPIANSLPKTPIFKIDEGEEDNFVV